MQALADKLSALGMDMQRLRSHIKLALDRTHRKDMMAIGHLRGFTVLKGIQEIKEPQLWEQSSPLLY